MILHSFRTIPDKPVSFRTRTMADALPLILLSRIYKSVPSTLRRARNAAAADAADYSHSSSCCECSGLQQFNVGKREQVMERRLPPLPFSHTSVTGKAKALWRNFSASLESFMKKLAKDLVRLPYPLHHPPPPLPPRPSCSPRGW